jgi:glycosyltransferase involved in cell wall biosynthesis
MNDSLLSIIIPAYNRADLIEETLESILGQTYTTWECILIDDCSTDDTFIVMKKFQKKDSRFKAFLRPIELNKGANSSRNYGFSKTKGKFIKWFDSDDIMLPNHLEIAYKIIASKDVDFVVTDLVNFNHNNGAILDKPFNFDRINAVISAENFAHFKIGWTTVDFLGTREIVEKIAFNEYIVDGDEYNFFIKLLHQPFKGILTDEIVTHRRIHSECITIKNRNNEVDFMLIKAGIKFQTAKDLISYNNPVLLKWFLSGFMSLAYTLADKNARIPFLSLSFKLIWKYFSFFKSCVFIFSLFTVRYTGKGYLLLNYARR